MARNTFAVPDSRLFHVTLQHKPENETPKVRTFYFQTVGQTNEEVGEALGRAIRVLDGIGPIIRINSREVANLPMMDATLDELLSKPL